MIPVRVAVPSSPVPWPKNPVMVAAGCGGTGRELAPYVDPARLGAFVTRSLTIAPRAGNAPPRIVETPSGLINAVGLQNPGVEEFLATELPWLVEHGVTVVVSVAGSSLGEYAELARRVGRAPGVSAVEVNVSAPAADVTGVFDVREPFHAGGAVAAVRRELPRDVPVIAKLRSDVVRVVEAARTVVDAGAAAVVVGNALPAGMPDGRPGGLSGPAIRPLALRCVAEVLRPPARPGGRRVRRDRQRRRRPVVPRRRGGRRPGRHGAPARPHDRCQNDRRPV